MYRCRLGRCCLILLCYARHMRLCALLHWLSGAYSCRHRRQSALQGLRLLGCSRPLCACAHLILSSFFRRGLRHNAGLRRFFCCGFCKAKAQLYHCSFKIILPAANRSAAFAYTLCIYSCKPVKRFFAVVRRTPVEYPVNSAACE